MAALKRVFKIAEPQYFFQPLQILKRLLPAPGRASADLQHVRLPWGHELEVNPREAIGQALIRQGLYDAVVTETLWRLTRPGDLAVDAGANIGYFASLLAARAGAAGRVVCFEPHPEVFRRLDSNMARCGKAHGAQVTVHRAALAAYDGEGILQTPAYFAGNEGTSFLAADAGSPAPGSAQSVAVSALDTVIAGSDAIGIVKLDVQGGELGVLQGMSRLLRQRRVRHIVFEEEGDYPAPTHGFLRALGYAVFGLEQRFSGVACVEDRRPRTDAVSGPPPNYLATLAPEETRRRVERGVWQSFGFARRFARNDSIGRVP
ncbi:MAG TPA: FkbM family methyltransferase [Methylomirabilota bacterium]|nr:FkbM family methyltransferase [Methylomirabilota bacterium]